MLYTLAMMSDLVRAPLSTVRSWERRGWIVPAEASHKLSRFSFGELAVARTLAQLHAAGIRPGAIAARLAEIQAAFPDVKRPLAELTFVPNGRQLLVRRGDDLVGPGGQLQLDFSPPTGQEGVAENSTLTVSVAPTLFLARGRATDPAAATAAELVLLAEECDESGDLARATDLLRAALAAGGPTAELCFRLAELLYRLGDLAGARERYLMAIELNEDYSEARASLGCVLLEMGQLELGIAALEGALAGHPEYADAHFSLARALEDARRRDEAAEHWKAFLELAPDSPWTSEALQRLQS